VRLLEHQGSLEKAHRGGVAQRQIAPDGQAPDCANINSSGSGCDVVSPLEETIFLSPHKLNVEPEKTMICTIFLWYYIAEPEPEGARPNGTLIPGLYVNFSRKTIY